MSTESRSLPCYAVGDRVRFTGFVSASWDYPAVTVGEEGVVVSAKAWDQTGFDYWVKLDSGATFAFSRRELASADTGD